MKHSVDLSKYQIRTDLAIESIKDIKNISKEKIEDNKSISEINFAESLILTFFDLDLPTNCTIIKVKESQRQVKRFGKWVKRHAYQ